MMGKQKSEPQLFNYAANLEKRVRANHLLRQVKPAVDFGFVREEVAHCYGRNGKESVAPEVILKMMFLLFFDDIPSERENSGLPDCSDPERAHPPGQSKSQEKCSRGTVFINPSG
jgi:hypothetical protein